MALLDKGFPQDPQASAQPLHDAARRIREMFGMQVTPYRCSLGWHFEIFDLSDADATGCRPVYHPGIPSREQCRETYEEALEDGIRHFCQNADRYAHGTDGSEQHTPRDCPRRRRRGIPRRRQARQ